MSAQRLDLGGQGPLCSGGLPGIQGGVSRLPSSGSGQKTPFVGGAECTRGITSDKALGSDSVNQGLVL